MNFSNNMRTSTDSESSVPSPKAKEFPYFDTTSLYTEEIVRNLCTLRQPGALRRILYATTWRFTDDSIRLARDQAGAAKFLYQWTRLFDTPSLEWMYLMYLYFLYIKEAALMPGNLFMMSNSVCTYEESLKTMRIAWNEVLPYVQNPDLVLPEDGPTPCCTIRFRKVHPVDRSLPHDLAFRIRAVYDSFRVNYS